MAYTFKYLMAMQFLSRGILFVFNSWIVRHLTEADYAVYAVQFQLCVTCVLFLSREGFRGACMRTDDLSNVGSVEEYATHLLKVAWMVFPIGLFFTFAGCALVFWLKDLSFSDPHVCPSYTNKWLRLVAQALATLLHCLTTYFFIAGKHDMGLSRNQISMPKKLKF